MADDDTPAPEPDAPDERDARLGALLAVEPLDDITRRRLVNTAIRSTGSARQARRLVAAAAVVIVLVAGAGVVVTVRGSDSTTPTASRDKVATATPESGASTIRVAEGARDVGDFGDLGVATNVARLRGALELAGNNVGATPAQPGAASAAPQAAGAAASDALVARFRALGCSPSLLPTGTVVALASGTLDGHPVIVVAIQSANGAQTFHAIETDTCKVHRLS